MNWRRPLPILLLLLACPGGLFAQAKQEQPFDPYRAEKSIEIGEYYMKKGNYDAAIDRFQDATRRKPNFAKPYRLMGEAYEKKGEKAEAVKAYQKYLEILPSAEDVGKIRKRIEKLSRQLERDKRRRSGSPRQKPPRPLVAREPLLFATELRRVRLQTAARRPHRMLYVQHFVEEDVLDHRIRNLCAVQARIDDDLIEPWVEAAELRTPALRAPVQLRLMQSV